MNTAQRSTHRIASVLAVSALALGLAACSKTEDATVGQRLDSAVDRTEQAATDARIKAEAAMQSAGNKMEQGSQAAKEKIDDATITAQVSAGLAKDPDLSAIKIDVDTVNGSVTLNGPATTPAAKQRAETIASAVKGVTSVNNQLTVTPS
ncbi:osmotically-inducible protein OsmY [Acidovorax soli]|jgi:osmotically-inducible protein OsmY|uniref:Osmotically-inducible protein OsmY n=1 Tax=Acidovorax soli TaxID=592050 RepID=A0A7X0PJJ0_9BURK|nr:BON domain-containing protein [Acidovorax soli]MBB6563051.1 osmotically-inducible protein OsmY [Acidovorax soli]